MAKVGYIFITTNGEEYAEDKAWMQQYGCVQVIEEMSEHLDQRELKPNLYGLCRVVTEEDELKYAANASYSEGTETISIDNRK